MHLIKDENGNLIAHGHDGHEHSHEHTHTDGTTHAHPHSHEGGEAHEHTHDAPPSLHCGNCEGGDCKNETVALLTYMLQHNEHHAQELDQMAENLQKLGMAAAAKTIKEGVSDFQKGNMRLSLALTLVKEELKAQ
ncbi:MAG: cobalt transporter [Blautia sp.]|nr:cobalt transporter [Blautia sp.]